jgi:hypothetical protein
MRIEFFGKLILIPLLLTCSLSAQTVIPFKQRLKAQDAAGSDRFGQSVAIDGNWMIVGASLENNKNGTDAGSVYFFQKQSSGDWTYFDKLTVVGGNASDELGYSVAIDGRYAVAGARNGDGMVANSGAVYVLYLNDAGFWEEDQQLIASDGQNGDFLGVSVAIDGNIIVAGAHLDDDNGANSGSVFVFARNANGQWSQEDKIRPADASTEDRFGIDVDLEGNTLVVGSFLDDHSGGTNVGSAYVYERVVPGTWRERAKLIAFDPQTSDYFGRQVSLDGDRLAISAPFEDDAGTGTGAVYIYERRAIDDWRLISKVLPIEGRTDDRFGEWSISLKGKTLVVGNWNDHTVNADSGSAMVFLEREGKIWQPIAKLHPYPENTESYFGFSTALSDSEIVIGASNHDLNVADSGTVFTYNLNDFNLPETTSPWEGSPQAVTTDRNVGIGTSSPSQKLDVVSQGGAAMRFRSLEADAAIFLDTQPGLTSNIRFLENGNQRWVVSNANSRFHIARAKNGSDFVIDSDGEIGIGTRTPSYQLDVNGSIRATSVVQNSDARLKDQITPIQDPFSILAGLHGYKFQWRSDQTFDYGVLAQETEAILPELVQTDSDGIKSVDYTGLLPILIEAVKQQSAQIEALQAEVKSLKSQND